MALIDLGPYTDFIVIAYLAAIIIIAALISWIIVDHRIQRHLLAELEAGGVLRRQSTRHEEGR